MKIRIRLLPLLCEPELWQALEDRSSAWEMPMEHLSSPPKRHICFCFVFCFVSLILALSTAAQVQNGRITEVVSLILLEQLFATRGSSYKILAWAMKSMSKPTRRVSLPPKNWKN